jgi:hypothetical protein
VKLIEFPEQTTVYANDQPEYLPLRRTVSLMIRRGASLAAGG